MNRQPAKSAVTRPSEEDPFAVRCIADGRYLLSGALSFRNARSALGLLGDIIRGEHGVVSLDLRDITRADSAGLALLIEAMRLAGQQNVCLRLSNLPAQVEALAVVSGLDAILPRAERAD